MVRPVIEEVNFSRKSLTEFVSDLETQGKTSGSKAELLLDFPTVYVVHESEKDEYEVYVGETTDIRNRTIQHLNADSKTREDWKKLSAADGSTMYVIGHPYFNKSLTLDVENRMMLYLSGVDSVKQLHNRRSNAQRRYYTQEHFDDVFTEIWKSLSCRNKQLFPDEQTIKDSALFKASPFHKLTTQQLEAKQDIHTVILKALENPHLQKQEMGTLILVEGAAGTGKTVLLSSLFYELFQGKTTDDEPFEFQDLDAYLLVNHEQQRIVYEQIAKKLGMLSRNGDRVGRPTQFINRRSENTKVDVVLVDEAHLLWTQGKQAYQGKNMLQDLMYRAKVVVAVFDPQQAIATNQYWEDDLKKWLDSHKKVVLNQQMRINSGPETWQWLRRFIDDRIIEPIPYDEKYDLRIFDDPSSMHEAIRAKNSNVDQGLSRQLATFDWSYSSKTKPSDSEKWGVKIDNYFAPWNLQIEYDRASARKVKGLSWAEQPLTVDEVGSIFTIQGFDLNYAGVIIGPSVKYRDGRIIYDRGSSSNSHATQQRGLQDGTKADISEDLLRNQLNILLTRGVHGLYIYAVDQELQAALKEAAQSVAVG
ncbi:MAG: DUF2075 domain-containing protein [Propionibacteriaceae bacterium]